MNLKLIYIVITFAFSLVFFVNSGAQSITQELNNADALYRARSYEQAYVKLKRTLFFSDSSSRIQSLLLLGNCCFALQKFEEAASCFNALKNDGDESTYNYYLQLQLKALLNAQNFEEVVMLSDTSDLNIVDDTTLLNVLFYRALAFERLNLIDQTRHLVKFIAGNLLMLNANRTDSILNVYAKSCSADPKRTARMSLLLPGLGQLTIHDHRNAANAFLLNAGLITACVVTAQYHPVTDAVLFWILPVAHYYFGNSKSAAELSLKKQQANTLYFYNVFIKYLSDKK